MEGDTQRMWMSITRCYCSFLAHTQSQQKRECRGRKPFAGARGVLAPPPLGLSLIFRVSRRGSAGGASPLPEREVSSLLLLFSPPQTANSAHTTTMAIHTEKLKKLMKRGMKAWQ